MTTKSATVRECVALVAAFVANVTGLDETSAAVVASRAMCHGRYVSTTSGLRVECKPAYRGAVNVTVAA